MDFNVQDPTQRGPLFSHFAALLAAEQSFIEQRQRFMNARAFTFPSLTGTPVNDAITNTIQPDHELENIPVVVSSFWSRLRGRYGR